MRIAVFIKSTTFSRSFGGLETQNKLLCEGLVSRGHEVTVYSPRTDPNLTEIVENGVKYKFVDCVVRNYSSATVSKKDSWSENSYLIFKEDHNLLPFDLILSQSSGGWSVIKRREEFEIPIVSVSHGTKIGELQTKFKSDTTLKGLALSVLSLPHVLKNFFTVQRDFIHGSDVVIAVSGAVKKALVEETFVEENKVKVVNNGIIPFEIINEGEESGDGKLRLLYVGQLLNSKGIGKLAELVVGEAATKDFTLDIVGSGELEEELKTTASKSDGKIRVHGKLPYSEVLKMYNSSRFDVFVFPTGRLEGFPMVLVEAMFGGLPIVAFNIGGVSDAVTDGETGFLVDSGNFTEFVAKLGELDKNRGMAREMGVKAHKIATERFSLDKMLDSYETIFKEVLQ